MSSIKFCTAIKKKNCLVNNHHDKNHRLRKADWRLEPQYDSTRLDYQKNQSGLFWIIVHFQWLSEPF